MAVLILATVFGGCSATTIVVPERTTANDSRMSYGKLNRVLNEGFTNNARILLASGEEYNVYDVQVGKDSTRFVESGLGRTFQVPTSEIQSIERTDRFSGTFEGLFFGALGGGAVGLGIGSFFHYSGEGGSGYAQAIWMALGVVVGAPTGLIVGAIHGHQSTYEFVQDSTAGRRALEGR
jgi:hypothetical protein